MKRVGKFGAGHAFITADGLIYRVTNTVTVNGVDLVVYEVMGGAGASPAAVPIAQFVRTLEAAGAVLCRDPLAPG